MVERLINEVNIALENRLYLVALNTALTLPDICGKAKYPELKTASRYKKWYQEHVGQYEKSTKSSDNMPYLSADVVYQLRCALLHQGNPNVDTNTGIDCFELVIEVPQTWIAIYADCSSICEHADKTVTRNYRVSIHRLCLILCETARAFYMKNKELFNFFNYTIIDMEEETKKMQPYLDCIMEYERQEAIKRKTQQSGWERR